ncbi:hypothetical protein PVAND_014905 [Polypedilum vanderplanki]|uniref:Peptidase S1 domain-containing protein n=1 Tax=Polypedilum vanderplanki TaxID=319348 RepID=A0A9J6BB30_POLVA|nr:hypothetical protein PVAND_014905 [Polypedilum vanderplanki]
MIFLQLTLLIFLSMTQLAQSQWVRLSNFQNPSSSSHSMHSGQSRITKSVTVGRQQIEISQNRANPLSFGGDYVRRDEAPWLCPIFYERNENNLEYMCGSSLISSNFVLTAAHCVHSKQHLQPFFPPDVVVMCGIFDLTNLYDQNIQRIPAKTITVHPSWNYTSKRYDGDIALIELQQAMKFSRFVNRIALPPNEAIRPETEGFVIGYGESEFESSHEKKPRRIQIPTVGIEECYQNHPTISIIKSIDSFCAGRNGVVPCNGDSGSSFHIDYHSTNTIIGVVSVGIEGDNKKCNDKTFALFSDVTKYVDWIKMTVQSGYVLADEDSGQLFDDDDVEETWKPNETFCEYVEEAGYRCTLRNVRSTTKDVKITKVNRQHLESRNDGDVEKVWIIEQQAVYIPEMSLITKLFPRVRDLRIWNSGLKYIERRKIGIFTRVRVLDFFQNKIEVIPSDAFDDMPQLEELKILNNRVKHLPENLFKKLKNLIYFFAEYNEIEELPRKLFEGTKIAVINLKGNQLKKINVDFTMLPNVNNIDLDGNICINRCLGHYCGKMSVAELQREINEKCCGENSM